MIELLIGMVLVALVMGAVFLALSSMLGGASEASVDRRAMADAADTLEQFDRDVRGAVSDARLDTPMTRDEIRAMILWGQSKNPAGAIKQMPSNACASAAQHTWGYCRSEDITVANGNELWIRTEADASSSGSECVIWHLSGGALYRTVRANGLRCHPGDVGATLSTRRLLQKPGSGTLGNSSGRSASFGYLVRFNAPAFASSVNSIVNPATCSTTVYQVNSNVPSRRRMFITNVTLDLAAWTTGGGSTSTGASAARSRLTSSATITSRGNDDYAYATGCGQ